MTFVERTKGGTYKIKNSDTQVRNELGDKKKKSGVIIEILYRMLNATKMTFYIYVLNLLFNNRCRMCHNEIFEI